MNKFYSIDNVGVLDFTALLILANSDSPFNDIGEIEEILTQNYVEGKFLIDQILHSGNTNERFIEFELSNGKIISDTIKFSQIPKDSPIRDQSRKMLCDNDLIDYSILSNIQKRMLQKGIAI